MISLTFNYNGLFSPRVSEFVKKKAASHLLTSTVFVIAENVVIRSGPQEMPPNLYMVYVGPPGTGKSQALNERALQPMFDLRAERDLENCIIEKCTCEMVKPVVTNNKAFIISPEVFEVLNKLLKSDKDNATGNVQVLCELFSGERSFYHFATERTRKIQANVPFSILGYTQVPYAA